MSSNNLYLSPTRLERAYAEYLLQTQFSGELPISGRHAVQFLVQSRLSRLVLREIWNKVDPQQHGKLVSKEQWWTLLKLVALAQQEQSISDENVQEFVQHVLYTTATPLAVFENVVIPPEHVLLQQYSVVDDVAVDDVNVSMSGNGATAMTSNTATVLPVDFNAPKQTTSLAAALDELGDVQDLPLPSLGISTLNDATTIPTEDSEEEDDFGDFTDAPVVTTAASGPLDSSNKLPEPQKANIQDVLVYQAPADFNTAKEITSLEAALEELGPIQNAPLPSLDAVTVEQQVEQQVDENDTNDDLFGDFEAPAQTESTAMEKATIADPFGGFNQNDTPVTVPLSSALNEWGSSHDMALPSLSDHATAGDVNDDDDDDDDFGDFEAPVQAESTTMEESGTADSFGGFNQNASTATVPLSSALDELGSSHDMALPSLSDVPVEESQQTDEIDDDFGDFEAPKDPAATTTTAIDQATTDSFGGFNHNATPATVPLSSALDELGSSHDLPLPALNDVPAVESQPADEQDNDDDDFGDFEGPEEPESTNMEEQANTADSLSGFNKQDGTASIVPLSLALDELGPTMDAPLPPLDAVAVGESNHVAVDTENKEENEEFGTFVAPPVESIDIVEDEPHEKSLTQDETDAFATDFQATVAAPVVPLSSALDELGSSHDAPLPSLDTFALVSEQKSEDDEDDDFGDFEEPTDSQQGETVSDAPLPTLPFKGNDDPNEFVGFEAPKEAPSLSSALDSLGAIQDAPLPPLGVPLEPKDDDEDDDDEFGDFEAPVGVEEAAGDMVLPAQDSENLSLHPTNVSEQPPQLQDTTEVQEATLDPLSSALDSLGPTQDAPLPPLGFTEPQPQEDSENDDDFGEFIDVPNGTESSDVPLASDVPECGPVEDKPLSSFEPDAQEAIPKVSDIESDKFGSFAPSLEDKEATGIEESVNEQSNAMEPSHDEPLPPLDSESPKLSSDLNNDVNGAPIEAKDISSDAIDNEDPFSSAFDAIAPVENSPLPSLEMHKVVNEAAQIEDDDSQEENFGGFEGPRPTEAAGSADKVQVSNQDAEEPTTSAESLPTESLDPFASAFDTIAPVQDTPLPSLGSGETRIKDAAGHAANIEDEFHPPENDDDESDYAFGSFENAAETENEVEMQVPEKVMEDGVNGKDTTICAPKEASITEDLFSDGGALIDESLPAFHSASGSDFSGFETASENITSEEKKGEDETLGRDIDDFGDFSGGARPSENGAEEPNEAAPPDNTSSGHENDDDDDFGDFTAIEAPVEEVGAFDAEWGDFEAPSAVETLETAAAAVAPVQAEFAANLGSVAPENKCKAEFEDFGSFQEVQHPKTEKEESLQEIAIRVQEMQKTLTIHDSKGGQIDFAKTFQDNIQDYKPPSGWRLGFNKNANETIDPAESLKRGQRCCQVMMLLTTSNKNSLSHWEKVFDVVRDELTMGSFLLEEAKSIAGEQAVSSALGMWVAGLCEYVRVTRSIAATLCDLLCLGSDADTIQMKNNMTLLDSALEIEDLWKTVESASKGLNFAVPKLETISDIRIKCLQRFSAEHLCQLTLQPLSDEDKGSTKNPVEWSGRHFFACAANFWSNRVSADVPV